MRELVRIRRAHTSVLAVQAVLLAAFSVPATAQDAATAATDASIVVTGARASREAAVERKREAPTIRDVVASDGIGKLPDYNTAQAVQRLPGVSVEIDQGEPRYVIIRGVDPNLNQVTIDGNLVGVPEAEGRRVALDTIPSDLVSAIEVVKAVTPDFDANAVGGSINLITPTAFDRAGDLAYGRVQGSYDAKGERFGYGAAGVYGTRFGPDETFGVVAGASYFKRFIDSDLAEFDWGSVQGASAPTNHRLYDYRIMRERLGAILNLDWRPNADTRVYVRNIYNAFTDEEERNLFRQELGTGTVLGPDEVSYRRGRVAREFRQNNQTQKLFNVSPGTELRFGAIELNLNYTYAHAQEHTPIRDDVEFRSGTVFDTTIDLSRPRPRFRAVDPDAYDPAQFPFRRIRERREKIDEDLHAARADLTYTLTGGLAGFVKAGLKYTDRKKTRDNRQSLTEPVAPIPTLAGLPGIALPPPENYYHGDYAFGPTIDYEAFLDYFVANPARFRLNAETTLLNDVSLDYDIREKIAAGYVMAQVELGDLTAIGGVRVERTDGHYRAFVVRDSDGDGTLEPSDLLPLTLKNDYTDVLPSIHLNYRAGPDTIVRAAWTNTVGRPNYDAAVPTFEENSGAGTAGNPLLQPYRALGLDLSAEHYPDRESVFALGAFYRRIKNPIFTRTILNTSFAGIPLTSLTQPQNADSGEIFGIEANLQRRFTFLPAPFDGLGVSINGTYTTSDVKVPGREGDDLPFFRQSKWIANAALFYEQGPFEARLALNYRDAFLVAVAASAAGDIYATNRTTLDARFSYRLGSGIEVFGSVQNITAAPGSLYQANKGQIAAREDYGVNADFGISVEF